METSRVQRLLVRQRAAPVGPSPATRSTSPTISRPYTAWLTNTTQTSAILHRPERPHLFLLQRRQRHGQSWQSADLGRQRDRDHHGSFRHRHRFDRDLVDADADRLHGDLQQAVPQHHQQSGPSLQRRGLQRQLRAGRRHPGRPEHRPRHRLADHQRDQHRLHLHQDRIWPPAAARAVCWLRTSTR